MRRSMVITALGALVDCYKRGGDFSDSSRYDNCDGIPKFESSGFLGWFEYTEEAYSSAKAIINSSVSEEEEEEKNRKQLEVLESVIKTGSNKELYDVLSSRLEQLTRETEMMQSRCFALVSVEGGPSKEGLDNIYHFIQDAVENELDLVEIQDEMEDFVQNQIDERHKFVVDLILTLVLDSMEMETIRSQLKVLLEQARITHRRLSLVQSTDMTWDELEVRAVVDALVIKVEEAAEVGTANMAIVEILSARKEEALITERDKLIEEMRVKSETDRAAQLEDLVSQGMSIEEARSRVPNEPSEDELRAVEAIDNETVVAMVKCKIEALREMAGPFLISEPSQRINDNDDLSEALVDGRIEQDLQILATIKAQSQLEAQRVAEEIESRRSRQLKKLNEKLSRMKERRAREIAAEGVPVYAAVEKATKEVNDERLKAEEMISRKSTEEMSTRASLGV